MVSDFVAASDTQGPAILSPQEGNERSLNLEYICQLLSRVRSPVCPVNGVVALVPFDGADEEASRELTRAECVVATGSDQSVEAIAAQLGPDQRFVPYGHKLSLALVAGRVANDAAELEEVTARIARDVALWDQQGCLSAAAVYVDGDLSAAGRLAEALSAALETIERTLPRGRVDARAAAAIADERDAALLRAVTVFEGSSSTVVCETDASWRATPLDRFVRVHPAAGAWADAIAPLGPHLSSVALAGFDATQARAIEAELERLGACRICPVGDLQAPPLGWQRDGRPLLIPLSL